MAEHQDERAAFEAPDLIGDFEREHRDYMEGCGHWSRVNSARNALRAALSQPVREPSGSNWHAHHVAVNKCALQMIRNALRNDVEKGLRVRGEMLAELDAATFVIPAPGSPVKVREPMSEEQIIEMALQEQFLLAVDDVDVLEEIVSAVERFHGITKESA